MKTAAVILLCLSGCTPLVGYVHVYPPIKTAMGRSEMAEVYRRMAELERLEAGYPYERFPGIRPCRKALSGPKCPRQTP